MEDLAQGQAYVFLIYILTGILIGVFFDIFRIFRRSFRTPDFITCLQDILFWIFTGLFLLYVIFEFNNGELRWYIFLGVALGIVIYILMFSKYFIKINVTVITFVKNVVVKILKVLLIPLNWIKKLIMKPVSFICINIRKNCKDLFKKMGDLFKITKNKKICEKNE